MVNYTAYIISIANKGAAKYDNFMTVGVSFCHAKNGKNHSAINSFDNTGVWHEV